ncbi:MAG: tRNA (adenosine(37)-N6)-threonylcarbamoyltransferase complex dimerization subunit type 1 TsaB [Nitrospirae bacterium]|nr:tRNA (adenosine(37)-N6)-threonylcarbamoyltransferase complex dimerization subunit type 1 TsaB [Nitrospirota bacterium]
MKVLAIDTATAHASAAVWDDRSGDLREAECAEQGRTSRELFPAIHRLLSDVGWRVGDLDGLALSIGPGSFTGLRIGVSLVKGFVGARAVPIAAIGTLDAVAAAWGVEGLVGACLDAKRGEIYARLFRHGAVAFPEPLTDEVVAAPVEWAESLPEGGAVWCVGDGALLHQERLSAALGARGRFPRRATRTTAAAVAELGAHRLAAGETTPVAELLPRYIRRVTAEVNWERGLVGSRRRLVLGLDPWP